MNLESMIISEVIEANIEILQHEKDDESETEHELNEKLSQA